MTSARVRRRTRHNLLLRSAVWVLLALSLATAQRAVASDDPASTRASETVAVIGSSSDDTTLRLAAELRFAGFDVEVVEPQEDLAPSGLLELARARGVDVVLRIDGDTVWLADPQQGAVLSRKLVLADDGRPGREAAVNAVEFVRAQRLAEPELSTPPQPSPSPEPVAPEPEAARRSRFFVALEAAAGGSPGGVPIAAHIRARARYTPHRNFGAVLSATAPLHTVKLDGPEGSTRILTGWVGVGPWFGLRGVDDPVVLPSLSLTAGPMLMGMQGRATPSYDARRAVLIDALFEAVAALDVSVSARVRIRTSVGAAACARTIRVRFAERTAATWCRPEAFGTLGVGVTLP